jgi:hypothetical protein
MTRLFVLVKSAVMHDHRQHVPLKTLGNMKVAMVTVMAMVTTTPTTTIDPVVYSVEHGMHGLWTDRLVTHDL